MTAYANAFSINGLNYNINSDGQTVTVSATTQSISGAVNIPSSVTYGGTSYAVTYIGASAFRDCTKIKSVVIANSVKTVGYSAFYGCTNLESATIGSAVTTLNGYAFYNCFSLKSITIPNSVTQIGEYAFNGCTSMTAATIGNSVTTIGNYAFNGCSSLSNVSIGTAVTSIGDYAFYECSSLASLSIPNVVRTIGQYAFSFCTGLKTVTIPKSVTEIGYRAFYRSTEMTAVRITDLAKWCNIVFNSLSSNPLYYANHLFLNGAEVTSLTIPSSITAIRQYAFSRCTSFSSITIPTSVTTIARDAFSGCSGLKTLTLSNSVTSLANSCFENCTGLTSVSIGTAVKSLGQRVFSGCTALSSIEVKSGNSKYDSRNSCNAIIETSTNNLIYGCKNTTIPSTVTTISDAAFYNCSSMTTINIPKSVTLIGETAFDGCSGITSITVNSANTKYDSRSNCNGIITTASNTLFLGCKNTAIPNTVTTIGYAAFGGCVGLSTITIPSSVTNIENSAFDGCAGLTVVKNFAVTPQILDASTFANVDLDKCNLYVLSNALNSYKETDIWKDFHSVRVLSDPDAPGTPVFTPNAGAYEEPIEVSLKAEDGASIYYTTNGDEPTTESTLYSEPFVVSSNTTVKAIAVKDGHISDVETAQYTIISHNNHLYLNDFTIGKGSTINAAIQLDNEIPMIACEFHLQLPDGISIAKDNNGNYAAELVANRSNRHALKVEYDGNGSYHFLCYSTSNNAFNGESGDFINLTLTADNDMNADNFQGELIDIIFSDNNKNQINLDNTSFNIDVVSATMGDVNNDGKINVMDIVETVSYIMGNPSSTFVFAAADIDGNGSVNVMDLVNIVEIIMTSANQSMVKSTSSDAMADELAIQNFSIKRGEVKEISIELNNPANEYIAFEFWMSLPEGVRIKYDDGYLMADLNPERINRHSLEVDEPNNDGVYHFLCYSNRNNKFTGTDGEIIALTVECAADAPIGESDGLIYNQIFSDKDKNEVDFTDYPFTVTMCEDSGITSNITNSTAKEPESYYNALGIRQDKPIRNQVNIVRYKDGTAKKIMVK